MTRNWFTPPWRIINQVNRSRSLFHQGGAPAVAAQARSRLQVETDTFSYIEEHGRRRWQKDSGFNRRNLVETAMYRYKTIIGGRLRARNLGSQRTETEVACSILNRMIGLGMPDSYRAA